MSAETRRECEPTSARSAADRPGHPSSSSASSRSSGSRRSSCHGALADRLKPPSVDGSVASICCCKFAAAEVPVTGESMRRSPPRRSLLGALVSHPLEALTVEGVEVDVVGLVGDQEIEDRPDERQAAVVAGERLIAFVLCSSCCRELKRSEPPAPRGSMDVEPRSGRVTCLACRRG